MAHAGPQLGLGPVGPGVWLGHCSQEAPVEAGEVGTVLRRPPLLELLDLPVHQPALEQPGPTRLRLMKHCLIPKLHSVDTTLDFVTHLNLILSYLSHIYCRLIHF